MRQGPRVLVTDADQRSVLAACRGLAAAGYRVSTVAEGRFALGHWSRSSDERITLEGPKEHPEAYVERLSHVLRRGGYDLVMPGSELSLLPISERRDLIEPYACLGLPPHKVVLRALDKSLLQEKAVAVGLPPPRSVTCSSVQEVLASGLELTFPLIAKPARSITWTGNRLIQHQKGRIIADFARLEAAAVEIGVPLTLQEYASRATIVSYAAVRAEYRLLGLTVARYERTYPPQIGSAALATTITPPPLLTQQVEELLGLIDWCGIFELELLEIGENRLGAIDFNPRPFGWMALAIGAGANLPALWCDHALGRRSVSPNGARADVHYRWEDGDIRNALVRLRHGRSRSAAAVLRPYRRVVHAHFQLKDPGPLAARMLTLAWKAGQAVGSSIVHTCSTR